MGEVAAHRRESVFDPHGALGGVDEALRQANLLELPKGAGEGTLADLRELPEFVESPTLGHHAVHDDELEFGPDQMER